MNKLRQSNIVRPDAREDGVVRTANITKFLAACASYGLPNEDLFLRDDLMKATSDKEAAVRVARTVIKLVSFVEDGEEERRKEREKGKWIRGGGLGHSQSSQNGSGRESQNASSNGTRSPYGTLSSASSRATASTPNLLPSQMHQPPLTPRKKWSPPEDMTPLRSSSPEGSASGSGTPLARSKTSTNISRAPQRSREEDDRSHTDDEDDDSQSDDAEHDAVFNPVPVPTMMRPPPRSPLRKQPSQKKARERVGWTTCLGKAGGGSRAGVCAIHFGPFARL
ncbi:hypothetical protein CPB84DRAFT_434184 [Gymnopilus junonius]|uniref:Uncharacterized protein n=1 Tax=Gymnopilus junonius TaxID=109634 RepID=A0A9P5TRA3_GYMJU|nr:hypothetical protein CPB84DRAFT_434184 [Gymnopilus junonius]